MTLEAAASTDVRAATRTTDDRITLGTFRATEAARRYVQEVLDSGRLTYGPFSKRFEEEFARVHGARFAVISSSGTSALHMALAAMKERHGWKDGDEVIVPAVTFIATVSVILHLRLTPVLVDVEPEYYGMEPSAVARAVTPRTRAILPVHLFGQPCDMTPIREIAWRHRLRVVEDSCETMFAGHKGTMCGSLGDIGCFSTYVAHLLVTGVGGINTTSDPEYARLLRSLANHGRDGIYISIDDDKGLEDARFRQVISRRFRFTNLGFSNRITEMEAALGVAALETWPEMIAKRRANAAHLLERLAPVADRLQLPATREGAEHSFMMFPLVLRHEPKRELVEFLEFNGVETRDMMPLTNQPVLRETMGLDAADWPVARWINDSGFYVGCHQDLGRRHMDHLADLILDYCEAR